MDEVKTVRLEDVEIMKALGGSIKSFTDLVEPESVTFSVGIFSPGEGLELHKHPTSEEIYYCLKGNGTVYLGKDEEMELESNQCIYMPPGKVHGVKNTGEEELRIAFICAPREKHETEPVD